MRTKAYLSVGAAAALAAALVVSTQRDRYASAQETTIQNQSDQQADQANRTNRLQRDSRAQNQTGRRITTRSASLGTNVFKASELIGMDVRGKAGDDEIGEINDVVIGADGKVAYVAVSFGGFLGLGDKLFAVPFEAVQFVREGDDEDDIYARIDVTEEQLKTKPGFNQDNWPEEPDESFLKAGSRTPRQVERPVPRTRNTDLPR